MDGRYEENASHFLGKIRSMFAKICSAPPVGGPILFYGNYSKPSLRRQGSIGKCEFRDSQLVRFGPRHCSSTEFERLCNERITRDRSTPTTRRRSSRKAKRMKRAAEKPHLVHDVSTLNEEILEAADKIDAESLAPEVSTRTAEMTVWDESPEDVGWRVHERPMENQVTIAEQLVSEGNEQADRERRWAADASDAAVAR